MSHSELLKGYTTEDGEHIRYLPVGHFNWLDFDHLDRLYDITLDEQYRNEHGVFEPAPGIYLHAGTTIHEERSLQGHHAVGFEAPVLWELSFPHQRNRIRSSAIFRPTVGIVELHGQRTFDTDWIKIHLFFPSHA
jgi:hypothetical protein